MTCYVAKARQCRCFRSGARSRACHAVALLLAADVLVSSGSSFTRVAAVLPCWCCHMVPAMPVLPGLAWI